MFSTTAKNSVNIVLDTVQKRPWPTGNQIRGFFRIFDYARDKGAGSLVILPCVRFDGKIRSINYNDLDGSFRDNKMHLLGTRWARDCVGANKEYTQSHLIQHRHYLNNNYIE